MDPEKKAKVIRGYVEYEGGWVPVDEKVQREEIRLRKINDGYVFHQNEWMTLDEKLRLLRPREKEDAGSAQNITIHNTYNISSNTDNRTIQKTKHEHKHVHVDAEAAAAMVRKKGQDASPLAGSQKRAVLNGNGEEIIQIGDDSEEIIQIGNDAEEIIQIEDQTSGRKQIEGPKKISDE